MYIPDWIEKPLCGACLDRLDDGLRPPWQPDGRERVRMLFARILPETLALRISEMARQPWEP